jgi:hypothetical protein
MSIAAGTYRAVAVAGSEQYGQTKTGTDQIVLDVDLIDLGERVSVFLYFSEKAAPHSMKRLRAAGWTGTDLANLEGLGSQECSVVVKYEEYQGEQKVKVEIMAGGTITLENKLDDKGKKAFGAKFRDLAKASAPVGNGATNKATF